MRRVAFLFVLLIACSPPEKEIASTTINMDSLLHAQAKILSGRGIEKSVSVGDSTFASTKINTSVNWNDALEAFRELGQVNRPIYRHAYEQKETRDSKSNLMIRTWTAKTNVPVSEIKLYYLPGPKRLKRVEAFINMKDFYFTAHRKMILDFTLLGELNQLESYHISGSQKYFWSAEQKFSVNCIVKP